MKLLVTGASGLLGLNLSLMMRETHNLVGVDRSKLTNAPFRIIRADLMEAGAVDRILDEARPEAVIHCAALANLEQCEADPITAEGVNANLPGKLAGVCRRQGIRLIHISTDAVFDGTRDGPYTETDPPSPLGVYSATKLRGEANVLSADPAAVVARVNFFGWSLGGQRSLSEFFFNRLSAGERCDGFSDVWFCPMFVGDLAATLVHMLERGLSGLYHVVGSEALTKYDFGVRIARRFGFDASLVIPRSVEESGLQARRSHRLRLSVHKLSTALGVSIPGVSTGLDRFYSQYEAGYPQRLRDLSTE